jgi:hypothetical protein
VWTDCAICAPISMRSSPPATLRRCRRKEPIMRVETRRQRDLFEASPTRRELPAARRKALVGLLQALLSEAMSPPPTRIIPSLVMGDALGRGLCA